MGRPRLPVGQLAKVRYQRHRKGVTGDTYVWDCTGRQRRLRLTGSSEAEVLKLLKRKAAVLGGVHIEASEHSTLAHLLDDWFTNVVQRRGLRPQTTGASLFDKPHYAEEIDRTLAALTTEWDVSVAARADGRLSIRFRSLTGYASFRRQALELAAPHYAFEGDVLDLLQPDAEYNGIVTFVWDREYDVRITLSKLLGLRKI